MQQRKLTQILNKTYNKKLYIFLLTLSSLLFPFYYGFIGVYPIDSFLIYDSGYKIINGYHPFKDYWSITGPILDYMQYIYFKLFGINWLSYVLHAASMNLLISLATFYFFLNLRIGLFFSFIYSLGVSILAYTSVGTPFMDHHAVIFSLISVMLLFLSFEKNNKIYWVLVPIFLSFSFLSKQIPSAYLFFLFITFILIFLFIVSPKNYKFFLYLFIGGAISLIIFTIFLLVNNIPFENFLIQYFYYPLEIGEERGLKTNLNFNNVLFQFKFIYISLMPLAYVLFKISKNNARFEIKKDLLQISFICISIFLFIFGQLMTKNQILIFFLIPFCLGISHYYCKKYYNKKFVISFLMLILVLTTAKYHFRFNENKKFMELNNVELNLAVDAIVLDKSLKGIKWITSNYPKNPDEELKKLLKIKNIILSDNTKKILITDYQILPSILKLKTYTPNKWFDDLSVPNMNNKYFKNYQEFFIKNLISQEIQTIYIFKGKEKYLKKILKKNCYNKKIINEILFRFEVSNCLN
jgi:hypothetical protein